MHHHNAADASAAGTHQNDAEAKAEEEASVEIAVAEAAAKEQETELAGGQVGGRTVSWFPASASDAIFSPASFWLVSKRTQSAVFIASSKYPLALSCSLLHVAALPDEQT